MKGSEPEATKAVVDGGVETNPAWKDAPFREEHLEWDRSLGEFRGYLVTAEGRREIENAKETLLDGGIEGLGFKTYEKIQTQNIYQKISKEMFEQLKEDIIALHTPDKPSEGSQEGSGEALP